MSLDKNKQQSPSHSLPLSPSPRTLRVCRCISCCPAATVSLPMQTDFPMTLSNMLICSCQRLFVRLDRICEVRCSARNACRRTGSFPASVCSSSLVFLFYFSVIWAVGNGNSQAASCSPTLYMCIWMPFRMCLIFCDSFLTLWVHCTFFIPEPGDACEKQSLEEGRGVIKAWE